MKVVRLLPSRRQPRKRLLITTPSLMHLDNSSSVVDAAQAESNIDPGVDESKLFAEFLEFKKFKRQTLSEHSVNEGNQSINH